MSFSFSKTLVIALIVLLADAAVASEPPLDLSSYVKTVLPSVVKIKIQRGEGTEEESDLIAFDGGGSGFVFDDQHHIMTNAHVVKEAKKIVIIDHNQYEYPALLIGKDDKTDIALLVAPTFTAPPLKSGNSSALSIGEGIFVIGSPFSLGHSVSYGIVSMTGRYLSNYPYIPFIQTDAAINPGNSGGAVFNLQGELVAMASTYYSRQGGYTNIGFAIPLADMRRIGEKLIRDRKVKRGYLGAELILSEKISRKYGSTNGIFISRVFPDTPAAKGGLKSGDIVLKVNDLSVRNGGELHRYLENSNPGDTLKFALLRNKMDVTVTLESEPETKYELTTNAGTSDASEKVGLIVSESFEGVQIVTAHSGAKAIGIDPGDRILQLNGTPIRTLKELNTQLAKLKENELGLLMLQRNNESIILPIGSKTALKVHSTLN